jgi:hypothetical protein
MERSQIQVGRGGGRHGSGGDEEEDGATASVVSGSGARPE